MNQENKNILDELEHIPIAMPSDSYFEALKKNVLKEIKKEGSHNRKARIVPMYQRWYIWGSAAAVLAFLFLFPWNSPNSPTPSESVNLSSVSNEEIYNYLTENIEDLDAETIALHLNKDALTENETEKNTSEINTQEAFTSKSPLLENVKDEEILDYLKDESGELDEYLLIES